MGAVGDKTESQRTSGWPGRKRECAEKWGLLNPLQPTGKRERKCDLPDITLQEIIGP